MAFETPLLDLAFGLVVDAVSKAPGAVMNFANAATGAAMDMGRSVGGFARDITTSLGSVANTSGLDAGVARAPEISAPAQSQSIHDVSEANLGQFSAPTFGAGGVGGRGMGGIC